MRKIKSVYPNVPDLDVPGKTFEGEVTHCRRTYGFVTSPELGELYFYNSGQIKLGDEVEFEVGQNRSGEVVCHSVRRGG